MNGNDTPELWNQCDVHRVILLGDRDILERIQELHQQASAHGAMIVDTHVFAPGEARGQDALHEVPAVVTALRRAIELGADIWVPFPLEDLTREQHVRQLDLVLERSGLDLLLGPHLSRCPAEGIHAVDHAMRGEVHAVDDLDRAVLASPRSKTLAEEIEAYLIEAAENHSDDTPTQQSEDVSGVHNDRVRQRLIELAGQVGPTPPIPSPAGSWASRKEPLRRLAAWLADDAGQTQSQIAQIFDGLGHRSATGLGFKQEMVSRLLGARYDRGVAR